MNSGDSIFENAKSMRKNPTIAEEILWKFIRKKELGSKFRRQHVIGDFIVDFVDLKSGIIIEVDGEYHNEAQQIITDKERTDILKAKGYKVLRFSNNEVIYNIDYVITEIKKNLSH